METAIRNQPVILGTAGHIDHGKTSLVARLTGIATDRLPEEKARGISIDLGFAHWTAEHRDSEHPENDMDFQFGVVDVPGHERFVKNMVAGATGVNLAILVVAADDGVMPQTREHLEIMDLLGIQQGVIAITKTDLVDPDYVELVEVEIEETVAGTFLEGMPIVQVSSHTGLGIDELKATITKKAAEIDWGINIPYFRMPIDRVFSITGHGTVVTGSVISGEVNPGEMLELLPEKTEVRVRSVQIHGSGVEHGAERQRTAVNIAGIKTEEIFRGQELATKGYLQPTQRLVVEIRALSSSPLKLKDRLELSLHLGTAELTARLIFKGKQLMPGEKGYAELRLDKPAVACYGQRFILRRISPALTVAGGVVLDAYVEPGKRIKNLTEYAEKMNLPNEKDRLSNLLTLADLVENDPKEAAWRVAVNPNRYDDLIEEMKAENLLVSIKGKDRKLWIHKQRLESLSKSIMRTIREEIAKNQPRRSLPRNTLMTACRELARSEVVEAVFAFLLKSKELVTVGGNLGPSDGQVKLTKRQNLTLEKLLGQIEDAGLTPPTIKAMAAEVGEKIGDLTTLLNVCVEDGLLVKLGDSLLFPPSALEEARQACQTILKEKGQATMSELREAWGISRKFAVPICEHFDQKKITIRKDDLRVPGPEIAIAIC